MVQDEDIARRATLSRTIDEDPRMAAQRSPGLRGEWCVQQMTYETDILPPFLFMPCWIRRACTYLCLSVIWPALHRMRQMTASEFRHGEGAHGVTPSSDGAFTIQLPAMAPRPKTLLQSAVCIASASFQEALGCCRKRANLALSWQHRSGQANPCRSESHANADDAHAQAG